MSYLKRIGDEAFSGCTKLSYCNITNTITLEEVGDFAFAYTNLEEASISFNIGYAPFAGCKNLKRVSCHPGVHYSDDCGAITDTNTNTLVEYFPFSTGIPASVKTLGKYAFCGDFLTSFDIPEGIEFIDANAFDGCYNLQSLSIPETVTELTIWSFINTNVNTGKSWFS